MSEEPVEQHLKALIPENLDEIVRANRDKFRLAFATEDEMKSLERDIPFGRAGSAHAGGVDVR